MSTLESYERKAKEPTTHLSVQLLQMKKKHSSISFQYSDRQPQPDSDSHVHAPMRKHTRSRHFDEEEDMQKELKLATQAYADAEQGIENLALFNEDMSTISMNVYQIQNLFELISKENEEIIGWMNQLERQTISMEEKHFKLERKIDGLINNVQ